MLSPRFPPTLIQSASSPFAVPRRPRHPGTSLVHLKGLLGMALLGSCSVLADLPRQEALGGCSDHGVLNTELWHFILSDPRASGLLLSAQQLHDGLPHLFKILPLSLHEVIVGNLTLEAHPSRA